MELIVNDNVVGEIDEEPEPRFRLFRADVWSGDYILAGERLNGTADVPEDVDDWLDTAHIGMEPGDSKEYEDNTGNIWSLTCE